MKKNNVRIISLLLVLAIAVTATFALVACNKKENVQSPSAEQLSIYDALKGESDRVILFIGDGMGVNHVKAGETYFDRTMFADFNNTGLVKTSCKALNQPTDSAAAASAMATGEKYFRGYVSFKDNKN